MPRLARPKSEIREAKLNTKYRAEWFDPRNGTWQDAGTGTLRSSMIGVLTVPSFPSDEYWALRLRASE